MSQRAAKKTERDKKNGRLKSVKIRTPKPVIQQIFIIHIRSYFEFFLVIEASVISVLDNQ